MIDEIGALRELIKMLPRPLLNFYEGWQDEAGLDNTIWSTALTGTGAVTRVATGPPIYHAITGPGNGDTARLYSDHRWPCGALSVWGENTIARVLYQEFEAQFATVTSIDNTAFFMGLGAQQAATRAANNIVGWILTADALNSITDDGIGETVNTVGGPTLTNWHKYLIKISAGKIEFFIDQVLVATHTGAAENIDDLLLWQVFYVPQEAGANSGTLRLGPVRAWMEDIVR